jgi:spermidine/putrescine transport system permease protein
VHRPSGWLRAVGGAAFVFLYLPLVVVVAYSFNDSRLNAEWVGFTGRWYVTLLHDEAMLLAARNSLLVALTASVVSTVLGTLAGLALYRRPRQRVLPMNVSLGLVSIVLSHVAFCIGFVAVVVRARLQGLDPSLIEAARDLGATPWQAFRRVTLPLIAPGIAAGALLAFTLSLDDFVITFFTAGPEASTLPLQIYSMIRIAVTPEVNAVSTLLMALTLALAALAGRIAPGALRGRA